MRKNRLYILLIITLSVILFSTSAICNQCSTDKDMASATETETGGTQEEVAEDTTATSATSAPEETTSETTKSTATTTTTEATTTTTSSGTAAPTINLEIYEGPLYASSDGKCYYRIEAVVTGNPSPTVAFSKDDSFGAWGPLKCQINLEDPSDTYTLTATATNSAGSATDSISITWGCSEEMTTGGTAPSETTSTATVTKHGTVYDLLANASEANWISSSPSTDKIIVVFNTGPSDESYGGWAGYLEDFDMEDGIMYSRALYTNPNWNYHGTIQGIYPLITLPENARFTAKVGFLGMDGTSVSDGVDFSFIIKIGEVNSESFSIYDNYDGSLKTLEADLSDFAGLEVRPYLIVDSRETTAHDWACWVEAKITN